MKGTPGRKPRISTELVQATGSEMHRNGTEHDYFARVALRMAGFKPRHLRHALARTIEALDANKTEIAKYHGEITDERSYTDHRTRLTAANEVFKMIPGMYAKEEKQGSGATIAVEIVTLAADGTKTSIRLGGATSTP